MQWGWQTFWCNAFVHFQLTECDWLFVSLWPYEELLSGPGCHPCLCPMTAGIGSSRPPWCWAQEQMNNTLFAPIKIVANKITNNEQSRLVFTPKPTWETESKRERGPAAMLPQKGWSGVRRKCSNATPPPREASHWNPTGPLLVPLT